MIELLMPLAFIAVLQSRVLRRVVVGASVLVVGFFALLGALILAAAVTVMRATPA